MKITPIRKRRLDLNISSESIINSLGISKSFFYKLEQGFSLILLLNCPSFINALLMRFLKILDCLVVINLELFTVSEVSKLLKVNNTYVYKLIKTGYLKALKLGSLKVPDSELKRFIDFSIGKDFSDLDNIKDLL